MDPSKKLAISAIILTYNEESNIAACLESIREYAGEIVIVDSFSADNTLVIARGFTENIYQHAYTSHSQQWDWAFSNVTLKNEWVIALDADFRVTPQLWEALAERLSLGRQEVAGFYVRHRQMFLERPILYGGVYSRHWLRIFRINKVRVDTNERVDVHFYVEGETELLDYDIIESNMKDKNLHFWIAKQKRFALRQAQELTFRSKNRIPYHVRPSLRGSVEQRRLFWKVLYFRLPLFLRCILYFLYRYIVLLGFLDRKAGLVYHGTQGLLYRLFIDVNIVRLLLGRAA